MELITRQFARLRGLVRYCTGKPCARGHVAERYVASTDCVECARSNALRKRARNFDHYRAKAREYDKRKREKLRPVREAEKARRKTERDARRIARLDHWREKSRAWHLAHPGYIRAWKDASIEKVRGYRRKREKYGDRGQILVVLTKAQRGRCAYCRCKLADDDTHVDHIMARANGGSNAISNLQLTCSTCNGRKGVKPPEAFARELGRLL